MKLIIDKNTGLVLAKCSSNVVPSKGLVFAADDAVISEAQLDGLEGNFKDWLVYPAANLGEAESLQRRRKVHMVPEIEGGKVVHIGFVPTVTITSDNGTIAAGGDPLEEAVVSITVSGVDPLPATIDVAVNELVDSVALTAGSGALDPITAETPCTIEVTVADQDAYWDQGGLTIIAE